MPQNPFSTVVEPPRQYEDTAGIGRGIRSLGSSISDAIVEGRKRRRAEEQATEDFAASEASRKALLQALESNPVLSPGQEAIYSLAQDPKAFANLMGSREKFQTFQELSEAVTPPESTSFETLDRIEEALNRADKAARAGDTRRAELFQSRASDLAKMEDASGVFGNSVKGSALNTLLALADKARAGTMTQQEQDMFYLAGSIVQEPVAALNPATGQVEQRTLRLPSTLQSLLPDTSTAGATARAPGEEAEPVVTSATDPDDPFTPLPGGTTVFEQVLSGNVTGVSPAIRRFASSLPILQIPATEASDAAVFIADVSNRYIEAKRRSPRFAQADRQDLEKDFAITPKVMDSPQSMAAHVAVMTQIADRDIREHEQTLNEANISTDERRRRLDVLQQMKQARALLGPPRMDTMEQYLEFTESQPAGTVGMARNPNTGAWDIFTVRDKSEWGDDE